MRINNIFEKISRRLRRRLYEKLYRKTFEFRSPLIDNIFDYNSIIKERLSPYKEVYQGNKMYGIGKVLRDYCGYKGDIYCVIEHGVPTERIDNSIEYRDNDMPVLLVHSKHRRDFLADKTDKLMIPFGPNFMPYAKSLYTDFAINSVKQILGKVLLIYPQHNNDVSEFVGFKENQMEFIKYVKGLKEEGKFDTVLVCLYYIDIQRCLNRLFEAEGLIVVSAGKNINYDFPACFTTILKLSDFVVAQSITGVAYSSYYGIPSIFKKGYSKMIRESGQIDEDAWTINGRSWIENTERQLVEMFSKLDSEITDEQHEWNNYMWGNNEAKNPEELRLLLEFAKEVKTVKTSLNRIKRIANKSKYEPIRDCLAEAIKVKERNQKI